MVYDPMEQSVLSEDPITVASQRYALITTVGKGTTQGYKEPEGASTNAQCALKIRGVFPTKEDARKHAERLIQLDPLFDIYVVDMYRWLAIPPDPEALRNHCEEVYGDSFLNDLIQTHKDEQLKSKAYLEKRKLDELSESLQSNVDPRSTQEPPEEDPDSLGQVFRDAKNKAPAV